MEKPGEPPVSSSSNGSRKRLLFTVLMLVATGVTGALVYTQFPHPLSTMDLFLMGVSISFVPAFIASVARSLKRATADNEAEARQRVRQAEDKLSNELRGSIPIDGKIRGNVYITNVLSDRDPTLQHPDRPDEDLPDEDPSVEERVSVKLNDDRLTLAALWDVTHSRMELYHQIVTGQAKRSFGAAQVAMAIGFVLLVGFAVLAAEAKTTTAAISAGGLGAVGAAFAAYIGKTFIRSQESAASHLRAYFDQPLELSRYLAAERLLADAKDLTAEQRAAIISSLVQSIATAGQHDAKTMASRRVRGRQTG